RARLPGAPRRRGTEEMMRVVISGASSGIGEALVRLYAASGHTVGLISRRKVEAQGDCISYPVDVTDLRAVGAAAEDFMRRAGVPDLVIANAGVSIGTSADALEDADKLRRVLDVNVVGLAATLSAFAPAMRKRGSGTLAGIASVAGFRGLPGASAYS